MRAAGGLAQGPRTRRDIEKRDERLCVEAAENVGPHSREEGGAGGPRHEVLLAGGRKRDMQQQQQLLAMMAQLRPPRLQHERVVDGDEWRVEASHGGGALVHDLGSQGQQRQQ